MRKWREDAGLRQDAVAASARARGLPWRRDTIAAIEAGRREVSLSDFITLRGVPVQRDEVASLFTEAKKLPARIAAEQDAELKAARKLGISARAVVDASVRLWGRTLTQERDRVLRENVKIDNMAREYWTARGQQDLPPARTLQAVRGHITRALLGALEAEINGRRRRKGTGR